MAPSLVNVILHGVFGYVWEEDHICAYTPEVFGHMYKAGEVDYTKDPQLKRVDYALKGVAADPANRRKPDKVKNPVLTFSEAGIQEIDPYHKRFSAIRLPYPASIHGYDKQIFPLENYVIGEVYFGKASVPLNGMEYCPSLQAFAYQLDPKEEISLEAKDPKNTLKFPNLPAPTNPNIVNLHIFCTLEHLHLRDLVSHGMTEEGHIRRAFAALVDLFCPSELMLLIPNRFTPKKEDVSPPPGLDPNDIDPDPRDFGHVNCHYANLIFWPD